MIKLIVPLLFVGLAWGQSKMDINNLIDRDGLFYAQNQEKPFTGSVFALYDNGRKKLNGRYKNGIKNGQWTWWNRHGGMVRRGSYKNELTYGLWKFYHNNGILKEKGIYKNGIKDGKWINWHENGQKKTEKTYNDGEEYILNEWGEDGDLFVLGGNGKVIQWHESGKKISEGTYRDGKEVVRMEWKYFDNGRKDSERAYKGGKLDGLYIAWYGSGQKRIEGTYKSGVMDGKWTWYNEDKKIDSSGTFNNGERDGLWTFYTKIGNGKYRVTYTVGTYHEVVFTDNSGTDYKGSPISNETELDGTYLFRETANEYDLSNLPRVFSTIKDGKRDGVWTYWYDNGNRKEEGTYYHGEKVGKWIYWDRDGNVEEKAKAAVSYNAVVEKVEAEKAAAYKAATKAIAAADKAATDKMAADRVAADKVAAYKVATYKAVSEKAMAAKKYVTEESFKASPSSELGTIGLLIDDFGYRDDGLSDGFLTLDSRLTYAIIPGHGYSTDFGQKAVDAGFEVMVHMPMENTGTTRGEENFVLLTSMTDEEIQGRMLAALDQIPTAIGVNNHQGSKGSADQRIIANVARILKERNLFFIDSRTTKETVAESTMEVYGVPTARNTHFLDNEDDEEKITKQLMELVRKSDKSGTVIGIGHARQKTLNVLKQHIPELQKKGYKFEFVSKMLH